MTTRNFIRAVVVVALVCCGTLRAVADDLYFDFKAAGGGTGTAASPYNDLATLNSSIDFMAGPTTMWVSGRARGIIKAGTPAYRLGIKQWPGMPQFVLDGCVPISGSAGAAGLFTVTLPADTFDDNQRASADYVGGMVWDWDGSIDAQGRHYNWFVRAANAAAVTAESNTYFYEKSTHLLTFGVSHFITNVANAAAVTTTVVNGGKLCWARGNLGGLIELGTPVYNTPYGTDTGTSGGSWQDGNASSPATDTTGGAWGGLGSWNLRGYQVLRVDLDGLVVQCCPDNGDTSSTRTAARSMGYGIRLADAVGCTVRRCITIDTGYHGIGYIGNLCYDNLIEDCVAMGGNSSPTRGYSSFVFYTGPAVGGDLLDHNLHGCIGRRCTAFKYNMLGCSGSANTAGVPIVSAGSHDGFLSHTDNTTGTADGNAVTDVLWEDCWVVESGDASNLGSLGQPFVTQSCLNPTGAGGPADETNPTTYPVRVVRGGVVNGTRDYTSAAYGAVSFSGSSLHFDRMGINAASTSGYLGAVSGSSYGKVLFSNCEIVANLDNTARDVYLVQAGQFNKVLFRSSSVYVVGSPRNTAGTPRTKAMIYLANNAAARVYARGTIFGFEQNDWVNSGNNGCGPQFLITGGMSETTAVATGADGKIPLDISGCCYFNISDNSYFGFAGGTPTMNSEVNWKTNRDPSGFYPSRNGTTWNAYDPTAAQVVLGKSGANIFADPSGRTLALNGYGQSVVSSPVAVAGGAGMNGRRDANNFGAYQYGAIVSSGNASRRKHRKVKRAADQRGRTRIGKERAKARTAKAFSCTHVNRRLRPLRRDVLMDAVGQGRRIVVGAMDRAAWPIDPDKHLGLMFTELGRYTKGRCEVLHRALIGDAYEVLCDAARTFRPELGFQFSTHLVRAMRMQMPLRHAVLEGCRRMSGSGRVQRMIRPPVPLSALRGSRAGDEFRPFVVGEKTAQAIDPRTADVAGALGLLDDRARGVITGRARGLTLDAIGAEMGVTKEAVRLIERKALGQMREWCAEMAAA